MFFHAQPTENERTDALELLMNARRLAESSTTSGVPNVNLEC